MKIVLSYSRLGQVRDDHFADVVAGSAVEHQAERALGIVLADEHHGTLEERAAQLAAVEEQLAL